MGGIAGLAGKRLYLDANVIIYLLEGFEPLAEQLRALLEAIEQGEVSCVTSELTVADVLVRPFQQQTHELVKTYTDALSDPSLVTLKPLTFQTFVDAAFARAETAMKLPDAIHVAAALQAGCDVFLTNDKGIRTPKTLQIVALSDL